MILSRLGWDCLLRVVIKHGVLGAGLGLMGSLEREFFVMIVRDSDRKMANDFHNSRCSRLSDFGIAQNSTASSKPDEVDF